MALSCVFTVELSCVVLSFICQDCPSNSFLIAVVVVRLVGEYHYLRCCFFFLLSVLTIKEWGKNEKENIHIFIRLFISVHLLFILCLLIFFFAFASATQCFVFVFWGYNFYWQIENNVELPFWAFYTKFDRFFFSYFFW